MRKREKIRAQMKSRYLLHWFWGACYSNCSMAGQFYVGIWLSVQMAKSLDRWFDTA